MKRSNFLKTLSVLPFGAIAGSQLFKNSNVPTKQLLDVQEPVQRYPQRGDLVELFIEKTGGRIGNTNIYPVRAPSAVIEYQNKTILSIDGITHSIPNPVDKIHQWSVAVKTSRCKTTIPIPIGLSHEDELIISSVYDHVKEIINANNHDVFLIYDIILAPPVYHPETFEGERVVLIRGTFLTLGNNFRYQKIK